MNGVQAEGKNFLGSSRVRQCLDKATQRKSRARLSVNVFGHCGTIVPARKVGNQTNTDRPADRLKSVPSSDQTLFNRVMRELRIVFHLQLFKDTYPVGADRFDAQAQLLSDDRYGLS